MSGMGLPDSSNMHGMSRCSQPVAHDRRNCAPAQATRAVMRARFAGDEKDNAQPLMNGLLQRMIKPRMRARQPLPMQIDADVGDHRALVKASVPMRIQIAVY